MTTHSRDSLAAEACVQRLDIGAAPTPRSCPHSAEVFRWLYGQNPCSETVRSSFFGLELGGASIGHLGTIPTVISASAGIVRAQFLSDLWLAPDQRRRGLASRLLGSVVASRDATLLIGMTAPAYRRYVRLGYERLGESDRQIAIVPFALAALRMSPGARALSLSDGIPAARELDLFWESVCGTYAAIPERSARTVGWRVGSHPGNHYLTLVAREGSRLRGYAVLACYLRRAGLRLGSVVDLLTENGDDAAFDALIHGALRLFLANRVFVVQAAFSHRWARSRLARCGFGSLRPLRPRKSRLLHSAFLAAPKERRPALPSNLDDWFLTGFDGEDDVIQATLFRAAPLRLRPVWRSA